jgi:hypothetical protein
MESFSLEKTDTMKSCRPDGSLRKRQTCTISRSRRAVQVSFLANE